MSKHLGRPLLVALLVLALALAAAAWLQVRQYRLLHASAQFQDDYLQVSLQELQAEFLRLQGALHALRENPQGSARDTLQLRYDLFVSRVDLLSSTRAHRLTADDREAQEATVQTRAFVARADRLLGPNASETLTAGALATLEADLASLDAPIRGLVLLATHKVSAQVSQRNDTLANYNRVGIALTAVLTLAALGSALFALAQWRRIDERRHALEALAVELRQAQQAAESASQAKTVFLANMSHEIRTPFQGLLGMLELLDAEKMSPQQRAQLGVAQESAQHLLTILNDILDVAKLEAGTLTVQAHAVALPTLLEDVRCLMAPQAAAKALDFQVEVERSLPEHVELDGTRVRQVLFNLLSNAIKFTERGGITLGVRRAGEELVFSIADTGIGMDDATLARLFQRFSQGDMSRSRRFGGTGLGLEISRNLARLMGGDIAVQSTPGQGSCFALHLPLHVSQPAAPPQADLAASLRVKKVSLRVLAAEDNAVNREVLAAMLELDGHEVSFAVNGLQAVQAMRAVAAGTAPAFDLVLMDLHMPELDGIEATREIRQLAGPAASVPIIALTADAFAETRVRCLDAGMDDFLTKPTGLKELSALMLRYRPQRALA